MSEEEITNFGDRREIRKEKLAVIHATAKQLGWDDSQYRGWLKDKYAKQSAKELADDELEDAADAILGIWEAQGVKAVRDKKCAVCGSELTDGVYDFSLKHFSKPLCMTHQPKEGKKETPAIEVTDLKWLYDLEPTGIMQVFGETGTLKTQFMKWIYAKAVAQGHKVKFIDTEQNLSKGEIKEMDGYEYMPTIFHLLKFSEALPKVDVIIVDSIGYPVLVRFAELSMKQRGDAMLNMIAVCGRLKNWSYDTGGLVILTNQPVSAFGGTPEEERHPFGDKSQFAIKTALKTANLRVEGEETVVDLETYRSRMYRQGKKIAELRFDGEMKVLKKEER
jgi:hypothetical protein